MNIVFVCSEYPISFDQPTGGFGRYVWIIAQGLVKQGHSVTVICKAEKDRELINNKVQIIARKVIGKELLRIISWLIPLSIVSRITQFFEFPILWSFTVWRVINKLKGSYKIDIIEGGDFAGELFAYYLLSKGQTPTVIKLHTPSFVIREYNQEQLTLFYRILEFMELYCLRNATSINSPSRDLADKICRKIKRPINTIIAYPVAINIRTKKVKRDPTLILFIGKLQVKKGVFTLLAAIPAILKKVPQAKFLFIGPDTIQNNRSTREQMQEFILKNKLNPYISIRSQIGRDEITTYFQQALITVIPSLWENFPYVCLEAFIHESVVITSNVGGLKEMVRDNWNGLVFKAGETDNLAEKIKQLLHNQKLCKSLVKNAKRAALKKYHITYITNQTISYYQGIFNKYS